MGVCNCSMYCCMLLYVRSSIAVILMGKRELIALLNLSSWCLVMVERLFLAVPRGCLQFVIVVFPDHTHLLFLWGCKWLFVFIPMLEVIEDDWGSLVILRNISLFSLWENITSNLTTIEIPNDLMNLKEITMPASLIMCVSIGR